MDIEAAIHSYAEDLSRQWGTPAEVTLDRDRHVVLKWSSDTWEDGVPVTKMFHRNPNVSLRLPTGTKLRGVQYEGCATGQDMFDFYLNGVWYSNEGAELLR
jgi:hypothetical protein